MKAKEKNYKEIIISTIVHFLTYTIIIIFLFSLITFWVKHALKGVHNDLLTVCLSLISAILIYHSLHFACKSSTIENLKNSKLDKNSSELFLKRMNLLFVLCVLGSILFSLSYIILDKIAFMNSINQVYDQYYVVSSELADKLINYLETEHHASIFGKIYSLIIIEISTVISFMSLIPYQKKVLEKFNK